MTTVYMIRHADSPFILGQERTRPLSHKGEKDAKRIAEIMRGLKVDIIVSSPYRRAVQTIEGVAKEKELEISLIDELREKDIKGDYRLTENELNQSIKQSFEEVDFRLSGGESVREVQNRAIPVIKDLLRKYDGNSIIIGTHGNVMTIIMNYFNPKYGFEFWESTSKPDIYELTFSGQTLEEVHRLWG